MLSKRCINIYDLLSLDFALLISVHLSTFGTRILRPYATEVERLKDLSRSLNYAEDSSSENETTTHRSYRRLPRVIPLEPELPNAQQNQHSRTQGSNSSSNVIIVSGEKLQPVNWKRTKHKRRRNHSLNSQRTHLMNADHRDRASSPIHTTERGVASSTVNSTTGIDKHVRKDQNDATKMSICTLVPSPSRTLDVERVTEGTTPMQHSTTPTFIQIERDDTVYSERHHSTELPNIDYSTQIGIESRPFRSLGSEHLNTSDEDQHALITHSSTFDNFSNSEALSHPILAHFLPIKEGTQDKKERPLSADRSVLSPDTSGTFSVFLSGRSVSETFGFPKGRRRVTTNLIVHKIYPKPDYLRHRTMRGKSVPCTASPTRLATPVLPVDGKPWTDCFLTQPLTESELPENKAISVSDKFGSLNTHILRVTFRLHDFNVIPGGPWRGIIYLIIKKTIIISEIVIKIEKLLKFSSHNGKKDFEKLEEFTFTCLSSDSTKQRREPPQKFHYGLNEFRQSATAPVNLNEPCYFPYYGPAEFKCGHYAIPCIVPIGAKLHPSFSLEPIANTSNLAELSHSYRIYATLQCSADISTAIKEITTGKLALKVLSCGPLPQELENGEVVPALLQTFSLPGVNLAIQTESLTVQNGDTVRFHLFADQLGVIRRVRGFLLQILNTPSLDTSDQEASYKAKDLPADVLIRDQTDWMPLTTDFVMPFSLEAETIATNQIKRFDQSQQCPFQEFCANGGDQTSLQSKEAHCHSPSMSREERKAGCVVVLNVSKQSVPHVHMEQVRVTYYVRILIQLKNRTACYNVPISVVDTRVREYKMEYLGNMYELAERATMKLERDRPCIA
ncbi:hypothetical protein FGIG_03458 [Fasciola gigantica]|uniref:Uncharacterized protein n=1 Tax=Fasciola gigantica TaxID=46835 RepID=A0A504YQ86_FASGI|nr:hypothetical protein FGIG_03458 [Fasciola gigantica]